MIINEVIIIKNIIFDLGGVILLDKPNAVLKEINDNSNTFDELNHFFDNWENLNLGEETLEEKFYQCNFSKEIENKYKDILLNYYKYRKINKELIRLINKLKKNNYRIYILSDNNKESFQYYKNHELFKNIDEWILSCEYNTCKCDGKLFDILIKKFNLNPRECYFIDDNIDNINESIKHGIKGYVFNEKDSINNLYNAMKNNGIDI